MKTFLTTIVLLISVSFSAQEISSEMKYALKNDSAKSLKKEINKKNINDCLSAGNSTYSLLHLAIKLNAKNCFELLITEKADVNVICSGKTPLMYAAKYGNLEMTKYLIENKANVQKEYKGRTALDYAKKYKKEVVYDYLKNL